MASIEGVFVEKLVRGVKLHRELQQARILSEESNRFAMELRRPILSPAMENAVLSTASLMPSPSSASSDTAKDLPTSLSLSSTSNLRSPRPSSSPLSRTSSPRVRGDTQLPSFRRLVVANASDRLIEAEAKATRNSAQVAALQRSYEDTLKEIFDSIGAWILPGVCGGTIDFLEGVIRHAGTIDITVEELKARLASLAADVQSLSADNTSLSADYESLLVSHRDLQDEYEILGARHAVQTREAALEMESRMLEDAEKVSSSVTFILLEHLRWVLSRVSDVRYPSPEAFITNKARIKVEAAQQELHRAQKTLLVLTDQNNTKRKRSVEDEVDADENHARKRRTGGSVSRADTPYHQGASTGSSTPTISGAFNTAG